MTKAIAAPLTAAALEKRIDRAVADIRDEWTTATRAITRVGEIVLEACFDGDAHALLESSAERRRAYDVLAGRVDTLGVGLSRRMLTVAVRIAAYDHLVRGNHWKLLDVGRKEDLLPLKEPQLVAEGAKFAVEMGATRENLQRWVATRNTAATGKARQVRGLTLGAVHKGVQKLATLGQEKTVERVGKAFLLATRAEQRQVIDDVRRAREALGALERRLERAARRQD